MANHRATDGFAHNQTYPRRVRAGRGIRNQYMHHNQCAAGPTTAPQYQGKILPAGQPGGGRKHGRTGPVRRTASPGPCGDARPGSPGRRGSACGAGSHVCANDDGCSAERCACPCSLSRFSRSRSAKPAWWTVRTRSSTPRGSVRMTACHSAPTRDAVKSRVRSRFSTGQTGDPTPHSSRAQRAAQMRRHPVGAVLAYALVVGWLLLLACAALELT